MVCFFLSRSVLFARTMPNTCIAIFPHLSPESALPRSWPHSILLPFLVYCRGGSRCSGRQFFRSRAILLCVPSYPASRARRQVSLRAWLGRAVPCSSFLPLLQPPPLLSCKAEGSHRYHQLKTTPEVQVLKNFFSVSFPPPPTQQPQESTHKVCRRRNRLFGVRVISRAFFSSFLPFFFPASEFC